jgi:hypothetical protein
MSNLINNPVSHHNWDPSKGDFINNSIINENILFVKKQKRRRAIISFLALTHILLILLVIFLD